MVGKTCLASVSGEYVSLRLFCWYRRDNKPVTLVLKESPLNN